ncbi:hypothetical protein [Oscillatoria acuminata]|uniref:Uncharacterized protein n=1 Tax=Oscillatoria acuminata PCC 6304 TaxID=56110 RepID=K9TLV0_9CYAN|nr:hypothetical protein [Oscillatoria acuminata]AFY83817.1 hypothetical protein Oscil6304_4291 [Oscillatoria acuminata PCC 6304]
MGNIRIIGPRSSGKTSYLAALSYWPDKKRLGKKSTYFHVQAVGDEARSLAEKAETIICRGESLEPTVVDLGGIDDHPLYQFTIEIKHLFKKADTLNLAVRDYPGEIFDELLDSGEMKHLHTEFIDECLMKDVSGCLILLTSWQGMDEFYSKVLEKFTYLMDGRDRLGDFRLAVAMSKCERGELWPGRLDPEQDLFEMHFPQTKATLEDKIPKENLRFFAISTFGVLGRNDPRPNRIDERGKDGKNSVLRKPEVWRPYGMIAPLYWLSKGKRMRDDA